MTEKHMSFGTQTIHLNVDNRDSEKKLENEDTMISSASDFQVNLCPTLDITNLLFLKSQDAEICNSEITISSSPLTFVENESIKAYIKIPTHLLKTNRYYNIGQLSKWNITPLIINMSNYSAETNEDGLAHLSSLFCRNINFFILFSYSKCFFDANLFKIDFMGNLSIENTIYLSEDEISLLQRYYCIGLFVRKTLEGHLLGELSARTVEKPEIDQTPFALPLGRPIKWTKGKESEILEKSSILLSERHRDRQGALALVDFNNFSGINIQTQDSEDMNRIKSEILEATSLHLTLLFGTEISEGEKDEILLSMIDCNKKLISQGSRLNNILTVEKKRLSQEENGDFSSSNFVNVKLDHTKQKVKFIADQSFLANDGSEFLCNFPSHCSYVLGNNDPINHLSIGPLKRDTRLNNNVKRISNKIIFPHQRLASSIRLQPKNLYLFSNLICNEGRNQWELDEQYNHCSVLNSIQVDEDMKRKNFISKQGNEDKFYKMKRSFHLLDSFQLYLFDENMRMCKFPRETRVNMTLIIRPVIFNC